jgi:hypothetical protein
LILHGGRSTGCTDDVKGLKGQDMASRFRRIKCARDVTLTAWVFFAVVAPVAAQAPDPGAAAPERRETIIGGSQPPAPTFERCVDVQIAGDSALGCLNQKLKREVERVNPSINLPPIDARSPDVRVGNVNEAAVRQQYGSNYGRSAIPFRPPSPLLVLPRR